MTGGHPFPVVFVGPMAAGKTKVGKRVARAVDKQVQSAPPQRDRLAAARLVDRRVALAAGGSAGL